MSTNELWIYFYEWYKISKKETSQMISSRENVRTKHKWNELDGQTAETIFSFPPPPFKGINPGEEGKKN
jgi:hypothetical protein